MSNLKIYIAGSLFNEAEIAQRKLEGVVLEANSNYTVFNPITAPYNENKSELPTAEEIYHGDAVELLSSDVMLVDLTNTLDAGVSAELGMVFAHNEIARFARLSPSSGVVAPRPIEIVAVLSDIRLSTAAKYKIPSYSINHFLLGGVHRWGTIHRNFEEAVTRIEQIYDNQTKEEN